MAAGVGAGLILRRVHPSESLDRVSLPLLERYVGRVNLSESSAVEESRLRREIPLRGLESNAPIYLGLGMPFRMLDSPESGSRKGPAQSSSIHCPS